ncbi:ribonuclease Y [Candidatus Saccharibacteria bacterium]|nr:ribonuclease Y [Candidatus Saccharibacteria bacterium]MBR2994303.1 ribonuclease Y [Candidatus Saccharibacteria bacterium]MBR2995059.1 ribonuclease Y [Candidatus Saccharibacteria bacterium]
MEIIIPVIAAVVGLAVGAGGIFAYNKRNENGGRSKAEDLVQKAKREASEIVLNARKEAAKITEKNQAEENERRKEWKRTDNRLAERETALDAKLDQLEKKTEKLNKEEKELEDLKNEVRDIRTKQHEKLEKIAGLSKADARDKLMKMTENDIKQDLTGLIVKEQKEFKHDIDDTAQAMLLTAMERMSSEVTADRTVTALKLPDDDMKGRIIGKEGRNIQALQRATGVDVLVDDTPGMIVLSSFDPIRRQVARYALERLMKDGRINPASIEESVAKAEREIEKEVVRAGEDAAREVGVVGIPREILHLLGELKFRTSYGQNVLLHSIEMAHMAGMIAEEIGADKRIAKTATLLHDIGKAVTHKIEGKHAEIGAELAKKYGMPEPVVHAMAAHHDDIEPTTPEAVIVKIVDAISAARPGARNISAENFAERMRDLENIATSFTGIDKAYAISAGREIRVIVEPKQIDDLSALKLARDIANKIEATMSYPGVIKVNVIRETRAVEYAK